LADELAKIGIDSESSEVLLPGGRINVTSSAEKQIGRVKISNLKRIDITAADFWALL
jgi:hypothetical protein